jgi:NADH:quinone reductase (non-electrogenic)
MLFARNALASRPQACLCPGKRIAKLNERKNDFGLTYSPFSEYGYAARSAGISPDFPEEGMFKTAITEMFGIKYPIICGAMMWLCKPSLCAAVSNAGGMGNLTAGNYTTEEEFRGAIRETRRLTGKPFMVNITLLPSIRLTPEHYRMYFKVCAEERVSGIEFSGTPVDKAAGMAAIEGLKKAGVRLFHKVGSVRHAVHAEKVGYDGIYAAGIEEGGHPLNDDVTTMVLVPRIAESVKIPVVAVGEIGRAHV